MTYCFDRGSEILDMVGLSISVLAMRLELLVLVVGLELNSETKLILVEQMLRDFPENLNGNNFFSFNKFNIIPFGIHSTFNNHIHIHIETQFPACHICLMFILTLIVEIFYCGIPFRRYQNASELRE